MTAFSGAPSASGRVAGGEWFLGLKPQAGGIAPPGHGPSGRGMHRCRLVLFAQGLDVRFVVRIKEFLSALLPRRSKFGRCNVPVRAAFLGNGP